MTTKKRMLVGLIVVVFGLGAVLAVAAGGKEVKITGKVVAAPTDPAGKMAPLGLECQDGTYLVTRNAVAERMLKHVGKSLDVTGEVQELEGRKVLTPWMIVPTGAKVRPQPTG